MIKSFGKIAFCDKVINPNFDIKIDKKGKETGSSAVGDKDGRKGKDN